MTKKKNFVSTHQQTMPCELVPDDTISTEEE